MKNTLLFLFAAILGVTTVYPAYGQGPSSGCPIDFTRYQDSCYHIFATPTLSWWDAMSFCAIYGHDGTLATIETQDEQLFLEGELKGRFPNAVGKDFWLGANDLSKEGTWVWVKRNEYVSEYTRWAPGEPNGQTAESCLALYDGVNYQWNDAPCNLPEGFICEVPYVGSPTEVVG